MKIGFFTDVHYGRGIFYNRTCFLGLEKVRHILDQMADCDLIFNLGDTINGGESEQALLQRVRELQALPGYTRVHSLLGNHDCFHLKKEDLAQVKDPCIGAVKCVRCEGVSFILLDANFYRSGAPYDGTEGDWKDSFIPEGQLQWLRTTLQNCDRAIVLCHQCLINSELFGDGPDCPEDYACVQNGRQVREILEESGKVHQVLCGHNHQGMNYFHNGISYQTLMGVCTGGYAPYYLGVLRDGELALQPHVDKIR